VVSREAISKASGAKRIGGTSDCGL